MHPTAQDLRRLDHGPALPGVSTWLLTFDLLSPVSADVLADLDEAELARGRRYHRPADQVRFMVTRSTLRRLLGEQLAMPARDVRLRESAQGKPELAEGVVGQGVPWFNVSHSGAHALIALSEHQAVGVDIERHDDRRALTDLLAVFAPAERLHCREGRDMAGFYDVWAGKEAVLKAWGLGITGGDLSDLSVVPGAAPAPGHGRPCALSLQGRICDGTLAWCLPAAPGYSAAVALVAPGCVPGAW